MPVLCSTIGTIAYPASKPVHNCHGSGSLELNGLRQHPLATTISFHDMALDRLGPSVGSPGPSSDAGKQLNAGGLISCVLETSRSKCHPMPAPRPVSTLSACPLVCTQRKTQHHDR